MPDPKTGKQFCDWAKSHAQDPEFIKANWKTYLDGKNSGYVAMVKRYKAQAPLVTKALSIGLMLDCAMNAGEFKEGEKHYGLAENVAAANKGATTEAAWCAAFINSRLKKFTANSGEAQGRMSPWIALLKDQQWDMRIDPCRYAWCNSKKGLGKECCGCPGQSCT